MNAAAYSYIRCLVPGAEIDFDKLEIIRSKIKLVFIEHKVSR